MPFIVRVIKILCEWKWMTYYQRTLRGFKMVPSTREQYCINEGVGAPAGGAGRGAGGGGSSHPKGRKEGRERLRAGGSPARLGGSCEPATHVKVKG